MDAVTKSLLLSIDSLLILLCFHCVISKTVSCASIERERERQVWSNGSQINLFSSIYSTLIILILTSLALISCNIKLLQYNGTLHFDRLCAQRKVVPAGCNIMLATITQKWFWLCKSHCSVWGIVLYCFEGDYIYITPVVDQLLFLLLIPGSTCLPDHLVHLQSCRPEMQVGKPSRASLNVPSLGL